MRQRQGGKLDEKGQARAEVKKRQFKAMVDKTLAHSAKRMKTKQ